MGSGARTLFACAVPALVISLAWLQLEAPPRLVQSLALAALALVPTFVPVGRRRVLAAVGVSVAAAWAVYAAQPWELLPFRDERVLAPSAAIAAEGFVDFYRVLLPFDPGANTQMHALVLTAIFAFTLAVALLAAHRPLGAAGVTVAAAGWPATLVNGRPVLYGALALAAALWIPLVQRAGSVRALGIGTAAAALVVSGAAWASSATTVAEGAALEWESWDLQRGPEQVTDVRFAWDSNYDGIRFPPTRTVVFTVEGPEESRYWRASTLDLFTDDHWFEDLFWLGRVESREDVLAPSRLLPPRARRPESWVEQKIEIKALLDDHLAAAGTPIVIDPRRLGTVFRLSGGVLRVRDPLARGQSYSVWSYAPDPAPAVLARSRPRYPSEANRFLVVDGRQFPVFGSRGRERLVNALFADPSYRAFRRHRPLYDAAFRVAGFARTPYTAVLALESWFRDTGGFRYDESPPRVERPPLVGFVTSTKAGYCQHFAGAMAVMLRMLGVPSRVAVGFTSGNRDDGRWVVTDREAHAWVEVWFAGVGWVPFDPTPGRGTFAGAYSYASESKEAVAALEGGQLSERSRSLTFRRTGDIPDWLAEPVPTADEPPSLVAIALLAVSVWAFGVGLLKATLRRVRFLTRDPRRLATAGRRQLEGFLRDQGVALEPGSTLAELQAAVRRELGIDAQAFATATARARYGPPQEARAYAAAARRELRRVIRRSRRELSLWARARGFVSLRSLRREYVG